MKKILGAACATLIVMGAVVTTPAFGQRHSSAHVTGVAPGSTLRARHMSTRPAGTHFRGARFGRIHSRVGRLNGIRGNHFDKARFWGPRFGYVPFSRVRFGYVPFTSARRGGPHFKGNRFGGIGFRDVHSVDVHRWGRFSTAVPFSSIRLDGTYSRATRFTGVTFHDARVARANFEIRDRGVTHFAHGDGYDSRGFRDTWNWHAAYRPYWRQ